VGTLKPLHDAISIEQTIHGLDDAADGWLSLKTLFTEWNFLRDV
jgi:hypothetical protein